MNKKRAAGFILKIYIDSGNDTAEVKRLLYMSSRNSINEQLFENKTHAHSEQDIQMINAVCRKKSQFVFILSTL